MNLGAYVIIKKKKNEMRVGNLSYFQLFVISLSISFRPNSALSQSSNTTNNQNDTVPQNTGDDHRNTQETSTVRPDVTILQGVVKGLTLITSKNRTIVGFKGIPFGRPPVGNLRFKSPVAADSWNGTLDASRDRKSCPQLSGDEVVGEEDCLFLNVYTPQVPKNENSTLLPVMVYIHGGGFESGSGASSHYGPEYLLDKDVVLVVPNYRLGVLGFLSTGDKVSPGNYGLKDMVLVLRWVKNNIGYFGGDADRVTVFGQGTGSGSVELLSLSNSTNGLFHKYITESGSAFSIRCFRPRNTYSKRATELGGYLGCPTNSSTDLVNCLRNLNASQIVSTRSKFYVWEHFPDTIWGPTNEPDGEEAFLTDTPTNIYAGGKTSDIPWISGVVRDEGLRLTSYFYANPDKFTEFLAKLDDVLPYILQYHDTAKDETAMTQTLRRYYLNDLTANTSLLLSNLTKLVGDAMFTFPVYSSLEQRLIFAKNVQYFYSFEYRGTYSNTYAYSNSTEDYGVALGDELLYIYPAAKFIVEGFNETMSDSDYEMVDTMVQLWTSFATSGKPSMPGLTGIDGWLPFSRENNYLMIGNDSDVTVGVHFFFLSERMNFWKRMNGTALQEDSVLSYNSLHSYVQNFIVYVEYIVSRIYHWIVSWIW